MTSDLRALEKETAPFEFRGSRRFGRWEPRQQSLLASIRKEIAGLPSELQLVILEDKARLHFKGELAVGVECLRLKEQIILRAARNDADAL